ncbi:hypothetical protein Mycch_2689 [Mycolicibacterium chubuense NBB4]|uniref:STAS domain-containing protein n=1 Tax=Mycolicibacterium chubuense (strain NBB4) TaxID=710421 RepID=I4BJJ7_MYCCN|nr:STAS domain-containing protein [Mycolicibacterium chubuense]AFM17454.1 hypothetical protein Mycch_2689 [Mycolicibacterium chubuense NBB4]
MSVADSGHRKTAAADERRGRGLPIAQMLLPDLRIRREQNGTTVDATHKLSRLAHVIADPKTAPRTAALLARPFDLGVFDGCAGVTGDVDTRAAPVLAGFLTRQSRAGTRPIRVDLSAVTHLGSAALSVLADACRLAERQNSTCALIAPPGGTAHHVLSLVGLPTATDGPAGAAIPRTGAGPQPPPRPGLPPPSLGLTGLSITKVRPQPPLSHHQHQYGLLGVAPPGP